MCVIYRNRSRIKPFLNKGTHWSSGVIFSSNVYRIFCRQKIRLPEIVGCIKRRCIPHVVHTLFWLGENSVLRNCYYFLRVGGNDDVQVVKPIEFAKVFSIHWECNCKHFSEQSFYIMLLIFEFDVVVVVELDFCQDPKAENLKSYIVFL